MRSHTDQLFDELKERDSNLTKIKALLNEKIDWQELRPASLDPDISDSDTKETLLARAATCELWELIPLFVNAIETTLSQNQNPLPFDLFQCGSAILEAVNCGKGEIVGLLLNSKLAKTKHLRDLTGWYYSKMPSHTATYAAVQMNHPNILFMLINHGYSPFENIGNNESALALAIKLKKWDCFKVIAESQPLSPTHFYECGDGWLLRMLLENITLAEPGYKDEKLTKKRKQVFNTIFALPKNKQIEAINIAKNKLTPLGDFLLNYELGFLESLEELINPSISPGIFEKKLTDQLGILQPKPRLSRTRESFFAFDIETPDEDAVEMDHAVYRGKSSDDDSFESVNLSEEEVSVRPRK